MARSEAGQPIWDLALRRSGARWVSDPPALISRRLVLPKQERSERTRFRGDRRGLEGGSRDRLEKPGYKLSAMADE